MPYNDVVLIQCEIFNSSPRFSSSPKVACNHANTDHKQLGQLVSQHSNLKASIARVASGDAKLN
jgi:hypothetical protein